MKMDKLKYIMMALVCGLFTACMDGDYDEGAQSDDAPYGNNDITETNLLTIQEPTRVPSSSPFSRVAFAAICPLARKCSSS